MRHLESQHQQAYFRWAAMNPLAKLAFAIPNGGARSKVTAAILKAEGVKAGVPDVFMPVPMGGWHGLYIEFKAGSNKPTPEQREFMERMHSFGYACAVAYDWDMAADFTMRYIRGEVTKDEGIVVLKPKARVNLLTAPLKKKPVDRST